MPTHVETILFKILGDSKSGERAFDRINKRLTAFGAALTAASDAALIAFAKLGEGGAKIEALETRFARMASAFGLTADEMLGAWDKAAAGTIDRVNLMQKANQAALLGLPVDQISSMVGPLPQSSRTISSTCSLPSCKREIAAHSSGRVGSRALDRTWRIFQPASSNS